MPETNHQELTESIELLSGYHDRLEKEVVLIAKKLQVPPKKINSTLAKHAELVEIKHAISRLTAHRDRQIQKIDK